MVNSGSSFSFLRRILPTEHCRISLSDLLCGDLNSGRQNQHVSPQSEKHGDMPFRFDQSQCTLDMKEREVLARQVACKFGEIIPELLTNMLKSDGNYSVASVNELSVTVPDPSCQKESLSESERIGEKVTNIMSMIRPDQVLLDCKGDVSLKWSPFSSSSSMHELKNNDWTACCLRYVSEYKDRLIG